MTSTIDLLNKLCEDKITVSLFINLGTSVKGDKNISIQICNQTDGILLEISERGADLEEVIRLAHDKFYKVVSHGEPKLLVPVIEHKPEPYPILPQDDEIPF